MGHLSNALTLVFLACSFTSAFGQAPKKYIVPGAVWRDTEGNVIDARGGGVVQENGTFYWVGGTVGGSHGTVLYSSPDLVTWTNHGSVYRGVGRPKLVYSEVTKMWQIFGQSGRQLDISSSPSILGPYTSAVTPFSPFGVNFTDFGLFQDDNGDAYTLYSADHNNLVVSLISPDRKNLTAPVHQFSGVGLESPAMFKEGDTYYVIGSHKTAYLSNNNVVYSAQNVSGPWSVQSYIAPMGTRTWNSQSTFALSLQGTHGRVNLYLGDRWVYPDLPNSTYVWLPVTVDRITNAVQADWHDVWAIDTKTAEITVPDGTKYEAEKGVINGAGAYVATCPTCSENKIVTNIKANSTLTIQNIIGRGEPQWVSFHYVDTDVGDSTLTDPDTLNITKQRNATVSINGGQLVALPQYDTNAGIVMSVPLQLNLTKGNANSITIGSVGTQTAGDLDYIVVY